MGRHCPPTPTQAEVAAPREMGMRVRSQWSLLTPIWILEVLACPLHVSPTSLPSRPTLPAGSTGSAESLAPRKGGGGDEMALTDPRQVWGEGGRQAGSTCNSLGAGGWWVRGEPVGPRLGVCSPHPGLPGQACGFGPALCSLPGTDSFACQGPGADTSSLCHGGLPLPSPNLRRGLELFPSG